ncbi:MAG: ATP-binding cassette domain-containing protein, partial [Candidatus Firestonebacteria bacterium]|nr:ATP-binding cassette domain-containing protein [Candidatus Firestonebacteria bacterium]
PGELSGGEQQRVAIARALMNDPAVLLADEPTGDLDADTADDIHALLQQLHREEGRTILMVTHNPELSRLADRIVTLRAGQVVN